MWQIISGRSRHATGAVAGVLSKRRKERSRLCSTSNSCNTSTPWTPVEQSTHKTKQETVQQPTEPAPTPVAHPPSNNHQTTCIMNSFALLQDDVEDATDLAPSIPKPNPSKEPLQDSRITHDTRKPEPSHTDPKVPKDGPDAPAADDKDKANAPPAQPKEKDMSFDEYQSQKAQLSSGMASLNLKGLRKANDGKSSGFENMSVLRKDDAVAPDDSLMGSVPVKEMHENKALKDSTHAAVLKNAEIQSFFKRDPASSERRPHNGPRRSGDSRRGGDARRSGFEVRRSGGRGRGRGLDRDSTGVERDFRRDQRGGYAGRGTGRGNDPYRGGYGRGVGGPGNAGPGDGPNGRPQGPRPYNNGPKVPIAPNVDDTAAFPSL